MTVAADADTVFLQQYLNEAWGHTCLNLLFPYTLMDATNVPCHVNNIWLNMNNIWCKITHSGLQINFGNISYKMDCVGLSVW